MNPSQTVACHNNIKKYDRMIEKKNADEALHNVDVALFYGIMTVDFMTGDILTGFIFRINRYV